MGFFSLKATCAICGDEVGLNRFLIGKTHDGREMWKCPACTRKGGALEINYSTGEVKLLTVQETEKRVKCNVCGHIYCYDISDLERNRKNANMAALNAVGSMASAVGGTRLDMYGQEARAQKYADAIVDYSRCPKCHSSDIRVLSKDEYEREVSAVNKPQASTNAISVADELKKFKELLDIGVITKEEFDAQKTQLLGGGAISSGNTGMPQQKNNQITPATKSISAQPSAPGTWICTCGRNHPKYISSCVCGISKSDILNA